MHESSLDFDSHFNLCSHEHADAFSHSEHEDEMVFEFYMRYENEGSCFVLPSYLFQYDDLIGETNDNENFSLPLGMHAPCEHGKILDL